MRFSKVAIESIAYALPEEVWTSADVEAKLAPVYERLRLPEGRLELMTGIQERRFWPSGTPASVASAQAGEAVLAKSSFDRSEMDLLIHSAVCRDRLEPATASYVHGLLKLSGKTQIFDVSNACLGFLNAMVIAASMIESGQIERALICSGENGRPLVENTIQQLQNPELTRKTIKPYFANLTIGAGAVAAVLCRQDLAPADSPMVRAAVCETDTSHNELCQGDSAGDALEMLTDSEELLVAGIGVATRAWAQFTEVTGWTPETPDRVITHQVGKAHTRELFGALGLDLGKDFTTFETLGNVGSVSCPITLARAIEEGAYGPGQKAALLGIGSGLSSIMMAVEWPQS
ncbi:3-oxoacyl-ACP synthase III [Coraliomargarita akajimensis]|uniref:3-Oxoacyl-(Acyl-carrier-protein (ACP)) synthase III domain protein n=1 Tax=Coraliomargarita akajimensis (strain DSM 45221 / IAM 15411 / JCM 23193 / KCTC 12865 / 04OKA010-24) TaxID=583355 RepID=D5EKL2_CORAD|nr:3-oxoacyl-ACP synthase III [Coraliomargarita akajimensis]ADE54919.1 3-Oxoacyl-(acyl-carrier-protein (ACP)) synthase III domain protein [Coraliomargarita akajimensis DSM 45221]